MSTYMLVHGAWEGSWGWEQVTPLLKEKGHRVELVDLSGSFGNKQPVSQVTMESYAKSVIEALARVDGKVILVGHSLGGAVISQVGERVPEKVERLVYVAALLLKSEETVLEAMESDEKGQLLPRISFSEDGSSAQVSEETWRHVAFHDVKEELIKKALARLADRQATEPFMAKVKLSETKFGAIPKTYIQATIDRILSPDLQERMAENWSVEKVYTIESGHYPALSAPVRLAETLL